MPRFMDYHDDLKLPAEAIAQIADDTAHQRTDEFGSVSVIADGRRLYRHGAGRIVHRIAHRAGSAKPVARTRCGAHSSPPRLRRDAAANTMTAYGGDAPGGYLEPSLSMPRLTRRSAALTCS